MARTDSTVPVQLPQDNYNIGVMHFQNGNFPQAIDALVQIPHVHPHYITASYLLGLAYFELGDFGNAQEVLDRPNVLLAHTHASLIQGVICDRLEDYGGVWQYLQGFILYLGEGDKSQAYFLLGKAQFNLGMETANADAADREFREARETLSNIPLANLYYLEAAELLGRLDGLLHHDECG